MNEADHPQMTLLQRLWAITLFLNGVTWLAICLAAGLEGADKVAFVAVLVAFLSFIATFIVVGSYVGSRPRWRRH